MQAHFHPSVAIIASSLVDRDQKAQKPDLDSHSLIRFLDKFVYKNPKTADTARGVSIMQPLKATKDLGDIWLGSRAAGSGPTSVNSAAFWNKKSEDVAAEDAFFHKYFEHASKDHKKPSKAAAGGVDEDEEEDEIWKALVSSRPDVDGDGDSEGFDDLDEDEMASDDDESPDMSLDDDNLDGDSDEDMVDIEGDDEDEDAGSDGLVTVEEDDGIEVKDKDEEEKRKSRRKQMKDLPMFASTDDYAELLAQEEDGIF